MTPDEIYAKHRDSYLQKALSEAGLTIADVEADPELRSRINDMMGTPEIIEDFKKYSANQERSSVLNPTLKQYREMTPEGRADYVSRTTGKPFSSDLYNKGSLESVMSQPSTTESMLYGGSPMQVVGSNVKDAFSGLGRLFSSGFDNDYKGMAETQQTQGNPIQKILRDPSTTAMPIMGMSMLGSTPSLIPRILGGGAIEGTTQSVFDASRPEGVTGAEIGSNYLLSTLGEAGMSGLGAMAGKGKSMLAEANFRAPDPDAVVDFMKNKGNRASSLDQLGKEGEIGSDLVNFVYKSNKPEIARINNALESMPPIQGDEIFTTFKEAIPDDGYAKDLIRKSVSEKQTLLNQIEEELPSIDKYTSKEYFDGLTEQAKSLRGDIGSMTKTLKNSEGVNILEKDQALNKAVKWVNHLEDQLVGKEITPMELKKFRQQLDEMIDYKNDPNAQAVKAVMNDVLTQGRRKVRESLIESARKTGNKSYEQDMIDLSDKLDIEGDIKGYLGQSEDAGSKRAHSLINRMFGETNSDLRKKLKRYDELNGTNFYDKANSAFMGKISGMKPNGKFRTSSNVQTGFGAKVLGPNFTISTGAPVLDALRGSIQRPGIGALIGSNLPGADKSVENILQNSILNTEY